MRGAWPLRRADVCGFHTPVLAVNTSRARGPVVIQLKRSFRQGRLPWARRLLPRRGLGGGDSDAPVLQLSKGSVYERVDGWAGLWVGLLKQEAGHGEARLRRRRPCCAQTASCACPRRRRTSRCAASRPAARAQSRAAPRVHRSVGCIYPEQGLRRQMRTLAGTPPDVPSPEHTCKTLVPPCISA